MDFSGNNVNGTKISEKRLEKGQKVLNKNSLQQIFLFDLQAVFEVKTSNG
jgi:hypothetical protein